LLILYLSAHHHQLNVKLGRGPNYSFVEWHPQVKWKPLCNLCKNSHKLLILCHPC